MSSVGNALRQFIYNTSVLVHALFTWLDSLMDLIHVVSGGV